MIWLLGLAYAGPLADQPSVSDALDAWTEWVDYQRAVDRVPAVSYAVVQGQEVLRTGAFGEANPQRGLAASPDTLYSICSISKTFTSVAVMQQRDAGTLRLDDPLTDHLGWLDIADVHPDDEPITIRRVLTHSSGLPREVAVPYWSGVFDFPTRKQLRRTVAEQQTLYPSGRVFEYSNLGLALLGEVAAEAGGTDFDSLVHAGILDPLGMTDTSTDLPKSEKGKRLAVGHSALRRDGTREALPYFHTDAMAPAAGFTSTANDLARYLTWQNRLYADGAQTEVLKPATLREMQRVHWVDPDWETTWGLGFAVWEGPGGTVVGHDGHCPGYRSTVALSPSTGVGVVVLTNAIYADTGTWADQALQILQPAVEEAESGVEVARDPDLDKYLGRYHTVWGDTAVVRWGAGLAEVWLMGNDLSDQSLYVLERVEGHHFRRVRDDGLPGEAFVFEADADGNIVRYVSDSAVRERM